MEMRRSEWLPVGISTDKEKDAAKSWFSPFCDDMEPLEAAILLDIETDRDKKFRVKMRCPDGKIVTAIRATLAGGRVSITLKPACV
jgi:hypothetical protein